MDDPLERLTSLLAHRYTIERELGAGGMATVYLAHDVRHDRKVAVKVLRPEIAAVIGAARFLTEIKVTANLQHPHILPLHDSGDADGFLFYVMPYVEGESLRDRLNRETQLSVEEALQISGEVADGLSYAHGLGVVHRDIKPENILLTGGHALIADFGIAKAVTEAGGTRLTETGLSLGTPQYMSPEQAAGERDVDARSDVYALGCVTYEMLVGEPPHTGPNAQAIIAKVLTEPVRSVRDSRELVSPQADSAIRKALAKLAADRFASVKQFAEALRASAPAAWDGMRAPVPAVVEARRWPASTLLAWCLVAILSVVVVAVLLGLPSSTSSSSVGVARLVFSPAPADSISVGVVPSELGVEANALAISADGARVAFVGLPAGERTPHLYVRELDQFEARQLPGTESASSPFFSPDGQWLGFYSWPDRRLKIAPVAGGTPQVVSECEPVLSATWGPDGTIVMDHSGLMGLRSVASSGGTPEEITFRDPHYEEDEYNFRHPRVLPDGKHVLATAAGAGGATRRIILFSLETSERTTLLEEGWAPLYVEPGYIVFQRVNELWAVPFDIGRLQVVGTPMPVLDSLFSAPFTTLFDVSEAGTLIYAPGPVPEGSTSIYFVGRSGEMTRVKIEAGMWTAWGPRLSPTGDRIVFWGADPGGMAGGQAVARVWLYDFTRQNTQALTGTEQAGAFWPIWSPDGRFVVYGGMGTGGRQDLMSIPADGTGPPALLFEGDAMGKQPYSWAPGGNGLAFQQQSGPEASFDIALLRFDGDTVAVPLLDGPANEIHPAISPDGRWLAYASDQSGRYEIYLRRYPELDGLRQVSNGGGQGPIWRSDSRVLFFTGDDVTGTTFMRTPVNDEPGTPQQIWVNSQVFGVGVPYGNGYDVTPNGERLLVAVNEQGFPHYLPDIRIVFNWFEDLRSKVPR